ncbi:MAG: SDR family oxidoreductase [Cyanobacteria bacterium P01_C01_bin.120]
MGQNLAVIGCGYVGRVLAEYWQQQGHSVTGTATTAQRVDELRTVLTDATVVRGIDAAAVAAVSQDQTAVVVSVAPPQIQANNLTIYAATYLPIAHNLAKIIASARQPFQVIYLSSCSVYGDRQGAWVDETTPIFPTTERIQIIQKAEQTLLQVASQNQRVCILRLGGIYGPGRELLKRYGGLAGKTLPGKGDRIVNWIHLADIVGAIEFARANQLSGIYNVVDDSVMTVREQVALVCGQHQLSPVIWDESQPAKAIKNLRVSNQKLKAAGYPLIYPQLVP